jgi:hypothetical protein
MEEVEEMVVVVNLNDRVVAVNLMDVAVHTMAVAALLST